MRFSDLLFRKDGSSTIIVDEEKRIFTTNETGYAFLYLLRSKSKDEVAEIFSRNFSMDKNAVMGDINKFLETLEQSKKAQISELNFLEKSGIRRLSAPITVMWDITDRCNLKCLHCYQGDKESADLKGEDCIKIIDKLKAEEVMTLDFSGGEPLMRRDIFDILKYANRNEFYTTLRSNGTLIDDERAHSIKSAGVDEVIISLDGSRAETHEKRRGKNTFAKTLNGMKNLSAAGVRIIVNSSYDKDNIAEIDEIADLCKEYGVFRVNVSPVLPVGRATSMQDTLFTEKEICDINVDIGCKYIDSNDYVRTMQSTKPERRTHRLGNSKCEALTASCVIATDGTVYPCRMFTILNTYNIGNILGSGLSELWNSPIAEKFRKDASIENYECTDCENLNFCGGPCPADIYRKYGALTPPSEWYACKNNMPVLDRLKTPAGND